MEQLAQVHQPHPEPAAERRPDGLLADGGADAVDLGQRLLVGRHRGIVIGLGQHPVGPLAVDPGQVRRGHRAGQLGLLGRGVLAQQQVPWWTGAPESKAICATLPASSGAMVTPCTADRVPTACSSCDQSSGLTSAVVTGAGGGTKALPWSIRAPICRAFAAARLATTRSKPATAKKKGFFMSDPREQDRTRRTLALPAGENEIHSALTGAPREAPKIQKSVGGTGQPFSSARIFGVPDTAAIRAGSLSISARTFRVTWSSISLALRRATG